MIAVIATVKVTPGKEAEFEADFRSWAETVKANEPGTLTYTLNRSRSEPHVYYALEFYKDQAAIDTHLKNLNARGTGLPDFMQGPPVIQVLDNVV